ncbi:hypothetical protein [Bifidobacterium sp. SO1]|uniref:hypothetical protein n=1 Tax=Bifidobacterium sp. SO1 TaxID=2809029 RepID=UPI001BDDA51C|nr:hypothetical protein [Bifidobacterium sp. SO1]MBT1162769.1 hypothetical protein [Bifidobacterium sp. SO1]
MPTSQILGIRNTAEVTRKLDDPIETVSLDGEPLLARALWIRFERHINKGWTLSDAKVSVAKRKSLSDAWRDTYYYYPLDKLTVNDALQHQIDELHDIITEDSKRTACTKP